MEEPYLIQGVSDLDELLRMQYFKRTFRTISPKLSMGGDDESQAWQAKIDRYQKMCGCELGSIFLFAALFLYLGYLVFRDHEIGAIWWQDLGTGFAIVTASAVLGKVIGLAYAHIRVNRILRQIWDNLVQQV